MGYVARWKQAGEGNVVRSEALAALIRIAPFVVVLGVVWLRVHQNKLRPADLSLNRPVNWGAAITWWAAFLISSEPLSKVRSLFRS